ncbi:serine threonine protein kinase [Leptolyngbya sp. Heron Island J]|uniref:serine/threonine-protein kinase n=1 Tax=Leptolyngbya sp. Heron Island J TaxID=1385935 RepID=UPI0003B9EDCA|nr:serine/threonine-protein kinase [Leptolyngbya sp. Heron Island J]ESA36873.1 serine threonine protein kinase [Leptolyngbya sp. Heron Island J]
MALNFLRSRPGSDQPLGGRYKIVEQLGTGGFGQTFRAQDLHLPGHPLCVIKQLKPQVDDAQRLQVARRLFDTEAKVLYQLGSHVQIPHLLAHFEDNKEFYLAQELIEGHSLADEFELAPWDVPKVVDFLKDVLNTLAFVHEHRVIHRDLKPSNLIRRHSDNRIVVIDFGAVKRAGTQLAASSPGVSHTISIGTQGYMPSEQLAGQPQFSSDVYAVGIMGIQALTGRSPKQLAPNAQTGELDWHHYAPHIPLELMTILDTMVRYDFRARYPTAKATLNALQSLPSALNNAAYRPPVNRPVAPPPTQVTVPAMARPPQPSPVANRPKSSMATEVVSSPPPSPRKMPAIAAGAAILGLGLLIGRACTSAAPSNPEVTVSTSTPPAVSLPAETNSSEPSAVTEAAPIEPATEEFTPAVPIEPLDENTETEQPEEIVTAAPPVEPADPAPGETASAEPPETGALNPTTAQTAVATFYDYLSSQSWEQARTQIGGRVAQQFNPNFFQKFQQVSVENLQVQSQTSDTIEFLGQNTYIYADGSMQREARTFTVQLVDGQPRIVGSDFVRVIESR